MAQAARDENQVTAILGVSNADGTTTLRAEVTAALHALRVEDGVGGSDLSNDIGKRDQNYIVGWLAVSNADGVTPVQVYIDSVSNKVLVKST